MSQVVRHGTSVSICPTGWFPVFPLGLQLAPKYEGLDPELVRIWVLQTRIDMVFKLYGTLIKGLLGFVSGVSSMAHMFLCFNHLFRFCMFRPRASMELRKLLAVVRECIASVR